MAPIATMMSDPRVIEFFYGFQNRRSDDELRSYIEAYFFAPFNAALREFGIGGFAIYERGAGNEDDRAFVGLTGMFPPTRPHPECGPEVIYVVRAEHHGKGYAVEAAQAVINRVRDATHLGSLSLTTDGPNTASRTVAKKLGFSEHGIVAAYNAENMVFYTRKIRRSE